MSLESGRKLGLIASLISVILPIVAIAAVVAIVISSILAATSAIGSGTTTVPALGFSFSLITFFVAVGAIGVAGFILFIVAMHRLSIYYNEPGIFKNVLYAFIIAIISGIVIVILEFTVFATLLASIPQTGTTATVLPFTQFFVTYLAVIGIAIVFAVVNAVLYMRAFNKLADKSGVDDFKTAGLLYLLGVVLTIALVGGLLVWIAWIYAYMGFNKLRPTAAPAPAFSYPIQPPSNFAQSKRCPNCGTENSADAHYC